MIFSRLSATQLTQLLSDSIHATVVTVVVVATTVLVFANAQVPTDLVGAVFGGAIGYAAGRAGNVRTDLSGIPGGRRRDDPIPPPEPQQ